MFRINITLLCLCIGGFCEKVYDIKQEHNLVMVHALFRHGERITENFYPTDPHVNNTFYPIGKGSLTNRGKWQEYELGKFLRKRYETFLGNIYTNDIMEVRSTGFLRTRMSALLVAAGLWPPSSTQKWNEELAWMPIPVDYKPYEEDDLLNPGLCQKRIKLLQEQPTLEDVKKKYITPYKDLMKYAEEKSGKLIKSPADLTDLYLILKTEADVNLTLPEWTKSIYPEPLYKAASLTYNYFNYNPALKKINSGYLFKKILNDFKLKIDGHFGENDKKIFLYSGHESTLGHFLDALKLEPHIPNYGSVVLLEFYNNKQIKENYVKISYRNGVEDNTEIQNIIYPGCEKLCPVDKFSELLKDLIPDIPYYEACQLKND